MAGELKQSKAWQNVRVNNGFNYIEARERKLGEDVTAALLFFGPFVGYAWFYLAYWQEVDEFARIFLAVLCGLCVLAVPLIYRPPRVLRINPSEQHATVSRSILFMELFTRRYDLREDELRLVRSRVVSSESQGSGGDALLGCLLVFLGPLGTIASYAMMKRNQVKKYRPAYVLACGDPPAKPIAVFLKSREAQAMIDYYDKAWRR